MHGEEALPSRPLHPSSSRTAREFWASRLDPGQVSTGKPSPMERSSGSQDFKSCVSQMSNINSEVPPPLPYLRSPRDRATSASGVDELPPPKKGKGKAKAEETTRTSVKKRGLWNKEEDALLVKMVEKYGAKDWSKIAAVLPGHTSKSCRLRWWNQLNPGIHRAPFTEWEDAVIKLAHEEFGTKWALISRWLHNRTDNSVKNRFTCKLSSSEKVQSLGNRYLRAGMSLEKLLKTVDPDAPRHMSNGLASPVVPSSSGITSPQKTPRSGSGHNATSSLEEDVKVKGVGKKRAEKQAIQDAPEETFVRLRDAMTTNPRSSQQMNDPANQVRAGLAERTADLSRFGMQGSYHQDLSGRHASSSYAGREEDEEEAAAKMQYLQRGTKPPWGPLMDGRHLGRHYAPQQYDRSYWYSSHGVPPPYKMPWP